MKKTYLNCHCFSLQFISSPHRFSQFNILGSFAADLEALIALNCYHIWLESLNVFGPKKLNQSLMIKNVFLVAHCPKKGFGKVQ